MRRSATIVIVLSLAGLLAACGSTSSGSASGSTATTAPPVATAPATARDNSATRLTTADGGAIDVKAPIESTQFSAPVTYADPASVAGTPFTPQATVRGVPLQKLGSWTADPSTGQTPSSTSTAAAPETSTDLCAGQPASTGCVIASTGWIRLAHDAGTHGDFSCPADHPYLLGKWVNGGPHVGSSDTAAPGSTDWKLQINWGWQRDHWTITVWTDPFQSNPAQGINYWAQNWNTVFGDAWHFQVMLPCGTSPTPKP